jgi:hypothetical protein
MNLQEILDNSESTQEFLPYSDIVDSLIATISCKRNGKYNVSLIPNKPFEPISFEINIEDGKWRLGSKYYTIDNNLSDIVPLVCKIYKDSEWLYSGRYGELCDWFQDFLNLHCKSLKESPTPLDSDYEKHILVRNSKEYGDLLVTLKLVDGSISHFSANFIVSHEKDTLMNFRVVRQSNKWVLECLGEFQDKFEISDSDVFNLKHLLDILYKYSQYKLPIIAIKEAVNYKIIENVWNTRSYSMIGLDTNNYFKKFSPMLKEGIYLRSNRSRDKLSKEEMTVDNLQKEGGIIYRLILPREKFQKKNRDGEYSENSVQFDLIAPCRSRYIWGVRRENAYVEISDLLDDFPVGSVCVISPVDYDHYFTWDLDGKEKMYDKHKLFDLRYMINLFYQKAFTHCSYVYKPPLTKKEYREIRKLQEKRMDTILQHPEFPTIAKLYKDFMELYYSPDQSGDMGVDHFNGEDNPGENFESIIKRLNKALCS